MTPMYFSTNGDPELVDFKRALLLGQAPDKGLYMPDQIPTIAREDLLKFSGLSYPEIAREVLTPYLRDLVDDKSLREMVEDAYNYDVPLERAFDGKYIMRLDRGPTCSFKDFAARLMGRLIQYFLSKDGRRIIILTATSGDTGSAVAQAFFGLESIDVVVLFPRAEVTDRQRRQMTTLGRNVHAVAVEGKFDDCQSLVKRAFADPDLKDMNLSSANSINIGRLLPQAVYYFYAWSRLASDGKEAVISVPSGNFGDLMGGLIAMKMGLPVRRFIAATNENDEFPRFMKTGIYRPRSPSKNCISNAMNVGHPSNLARIFCLYGGRMDELGAVQKAPDLEAMRHDIFAVSISDEETKSTIKHAYQKYGLILEPHGAVGFAGLMRYLKEAEDWSPCISLETADPAKFPDEIVRLIGVEPEVPVVMSNLSELEESYDKMANDYTSLKALLRGLFGSKKPSREEVLTHRSARDISINKTEGVHETTKPTDILR